MTVQEFLELNESSIGSSGAKWDSCDALDQLNKARSALYGLNTWTGLLTKVCINSCCSISVPWFGERITNAYQCNKQIIIASGEYFRHVDSSCCGKMIGIVDTGEYSPVPIVNEFVSRLGFKIIEPEDNGKLVKITYINDAGTNVTEELILNNEEFVTTDGSVAKVISIKKDSTLGMVWVYNVDADGNCCEKQFAMYPLETNLRYRLYCISQLCCSSCSQLVITVKRKYFPFTELHYNHQIDFAEHALGLAMEAIAEKGKRTPEGLQMYQNLIRSAINYLKTNTNKEEQTNMDMTLSHDYPSIIDECGCS